MRTFRCSNCGGAVESTPWLETATFRDLYTAAGENMLICDNCEVVGRARGSLFTLDEFASLFAPPDENGFCATRGADA